MNNTLLESYRIILNELYRSIQFANNDVLTNNLVELEKNQGRINEESQLLQSMWESIKDEDLIEDKLDREVSRWNHIDNMLKETRKGLNNKLAYELRNIYERWLLNMANDKQSEDEIFSTSKLNEKYPATSKMLSEMKEKNIPNNLSKFNTALNYSRSFLNLTSYPKSAPPVIIGNDSVQINDYIRKLPARKLQILLEINPSLYVLGVMIMRYACLLIGGQQWAVPIQIYEFMVKRYNITIEGFASPINSQILYISKNLRYCSLFPDTDTPYGSLGSFFSMDFTGKNVYVNPPYVGAIMNRVAAKVINNCYDARSTPTRFFITVPDWTDAKYYSDLISSPFLVFHHGFSKGKHYYVDSNNGFEKITVNFGTHLFVLAVNIDDSYDEMVKYAERVYSN